jgi:epoxyqueuosine reductase
MVVQARHAGGLGAQNGHATADISLGQISAWAKELGFSQIGVASIDLGQAEPGLRAWLEAGFHGEMAYMARHGMKRARPAELLPGTLSVITARMDYLPRDAPPDWLQQEQARLLRPGEALVSVYARGRDYHKLLRRALQRLAEKIETGAGAAAGPASQRVFVDSAPVLEVELATRAGIGWRGKHTLALHRDAGSMFFLGEIYTSLALPPTAPISAHCGECSACISACPTQAIVAPYRLDARRCISYLTIESDAPIPVELRRAMGNRIYGCDDCQTACPWNKFAQRSPLPAFDERAAFKAPSLLALWAWSEADFLRHTEGSAIRRIGHRRWRRNLAVAIGNALAAGVLEAPVLRAALQAALPAADALVAEHIAWALAQAPAVAMAPSSSLPDKP